MQTWLLLTITAIVAAALTALGGILYIRAAYSDQQDPDDRLAELERQVKTIETRQKNIELEWENTFDKLRRLVGRVDRVRAVDEKKNPPIEELPPQDDEQPMLPIMEHSAAPPVGDRMTLLSQFTRRPKA